MTWAISRRVAPERQQQNNVATFPAGLEYRERRPVARQRYQQHIYLAGADDTFAEQDARKETVVGGCRK
ncbi:hypothetical protein KCP75_05480 [Salmonella enterica subsp. enterica]|nr:hypothetical protein KCP75_05480 [Salmonella enterica subsp. enterica]